VCSVTAVVPSVVLLPLHIAVLFPTVATGKGFNMTLMWLDVALQNEFEFDLVNIGIYCQK